MTLRLVEEPRPTLVEKFYADQATFTHYIGDALAAIDEEILRKELAYARDCGIAVKERDACRADVVSAYADIGAIVCNTIETWIEQVQKHEAG